MRKFRNNVSDGWLFKQELRLWRNFAQNWDRDVEDSDFFDPFANTANTSEEDTKAILAQTFPLDELEKIDAVREILREAAQGWLYAAERGGIGNVPAMPLGAREEADLCVRCGLLFPPDPYVLPEERELFLKLATRGGVR